MLAGQIPEGPGHVVEIGAGGGFLDDFVPSALRTEVFLIPGVRLVCDARILPFSSGSLKAIVMTNVFHHLPDPRAFLREASRTLRPGGVVAMLEPWVSRFSRIVYGSMHHEPFLPNATTWEIPEGAPLSSSNQALPWIVFRRDKSSFTREFPMFAITRLRPTIYLRYLVSGGVGTRNIVPAWTIPLWRGIERVLSCLSERTALFAFITLELTKTREGEFADSRPVRPSKGN